ncbi:hypothetical protein PILCRDRAFT_93785 [Piloderma croceum F 1598]|uniref:Uncharacterized protein n=1 Tax=Piloderma croceum (strain F 1598) TaxID=765440 RepID=A0A0C3EUB2_PILCF|nr:hypothetical protein PILCRDRAFT_93785 [Piloderma croceum F 1598]
MTETTDRKVMSFADTGQPNTFDLTDDDGRTPASMASIPGYDANTRKDWSSIMSSTKISCSAVLVLATGSGRPPLQSHTFLNVDINDIFLRKRSNIYSILVGTLLAVLHEHLPTQQGVPADLINIFNGMSASEMITVSTTRIPSFGDDLQNPVNGYRTMGMLSSIRIEKSIPSAAVSPYRELFAAASNRRNPTTEDFVQTWEPFGVTTATHFIIIFGTPVTSLFSNHATSLLLSSAPGSRRSSVAPSPLIGPSISGSLRGFGDVSTNPSRTGSPGFSLTGRQSSNSAATTRDPSPSSHLPGMTEAQLTQGTSVEDVCAWHGIVESALGAAKYNSAEKSFLGMVLNHRKMLEVLVRLGLQDRYSTVFVPARTVAYAGGLHLSAQEVVKAYGWSVDSYKHKTLWFGWAEEVSSSRWIWKAPVPNQGVELQHYQCWQGIKYIWAPGGPLQFGRFSDNVSESYDGQAALRLKQTHIDQYRTSIISCLEESVHVPSTTQ